MIILSESMFLLGVLYFGERNIEKSLSIGFLAFVYFILQALWRLPDPFWIISFSSVVLLIPA
jgi:hypothetical protein